MPPKRKRVKPSLKETEESLPSSGSEEGDVDSDSTSVDSDMEIQVDFEACAISEDDFHGVNRLLRQVFLKSSVDISSFTDIIIKQADLVGSSIKVCDSSLVAGTVAESAGQPSSSDSEGEAVLGVTSLVSLDFHKDKACVQQLKEMLLSQCQLYGGSTLSRLKSLLSESVGLLINERFLNIPAEIAPPLLQSLMAELKEASRKDSKQFSCQYYILITRSHLLPTASPVASKRKRKGNGKIVHVNNGTGDTSEHVFDYPECEVLQKESIVSFNYPVGEESDQVLAGKWSFDDTTMEPYRTVLVFEANRLKKLVLDLEKHLL